LQVQLVSPEQILYEGEAKMVVARTIDGGEIAFEDNHAPFLGALDIYPVRVKFADGTESKFAAHGGFVEVSDNRVIILSDVAELSQEVDVNRAAAAKARAEEVLRQTPDDFDAQQALQRAETRLEVAESS
jgi:F-type H+-transporting ATPase subunit epsilon